MKTERAFPTVPTLMMVGDNTHQMMRRILASFPLMVVKEAEVALRVEFSLVSEVKPWKIHVKLSIQIFLLWLEIERIIHDALLPSNVNIFAV